MKQDESNTQAFLYYKLFVAKSLILNPEDFFKIFDSYIKKHSLNAEQLAEIRSYENKSPKELIKIINREIKDFVSGSFSKTISDPDLIKYSYQYQKGNFIENISTYLKRYGTKIPIHPEEDVVLFGEDVKRISFIETLLALEKEELITILSLQIGVSKPHEAVASEFGYVSSLLQENFNKSSFTIHEVPIATIQLSKKLINLIEPNLAYIPPKLHFKGSQITISEGLQDSLCRVLFRNKRSVTKEWAWIDVLDKQIGTEGTYDEKKDWRKIYDPGRAINRNVAIETGIKDLLLITKRTIRVNPKYLPPPNK